MFYSIGSTAADTAAYGGLAAGEAEAGLVAADVLAAQWWLEEKQLMAACHLVKMWVEVLCQGKCEGKWS